MQLSATQAQATVDSLRQELAKAQKTISDQVFTHPFIHSLKATLGSRA